MYNELSRVAKPDARLLAFIKAQIETTIPYQIRAVRASRTQGEIADKAGMKQPRISNLERPGYGNINLDTLARIAAAMRVGLIVRLAPISEMIEWQESFEPDQFRIPTVEAECVAALHELCKGGLNSPIDQGRRADDGVVNAYTLSMA